MRPDARWASEELTQALAELTSQQARGVVRIVQAELDDRPISSLLDCAGQICTSTTYYGGGRRKGWKAKPEFAKALKLARRDYRAHMLEHGTKEALEILAATAPEAARALRQRVEGDDRAIAVLVKTLSAESATERRLAAELLGKTGFRKVSPALEAALVDEGDEAVREAIMLALGQIAAGATRDVDTPADVLDRGDVKTASKGVRKVDLSGKVGLAEVSADELAQARDETRRWEQERFGILDDDE